jgi:2-alkenal reductase
MNMPVSVRKLFVGGIIGVSVLLALACGDADGEVYVLDSAISPVLTPDQVSNTADIPTATPHKITTVVETAAEDSTPDATDGAIEVAVDAKIGQTPNGDAAPEAVRRKPIQEFTAAEIVSEQEKHFADLYEQAVQSVVFIRVGTTQGQGSGSGFVWDTDGHVVTNYHVIQGAKSVLVKFSNGREYTADVVAFDPDADLAVIKLNDVQHNLAKITIGNSHDLRPGELAIAIGNPFGEEFTMTTGIVSAVSRTIRSGFSSYSIPEVVQTDAAINPGNSGGPLLDMNGTVIGVNTQIRSDSRQNSGVGFAVPVDLVKRVIPSLIQDGFHTYSLMGISGTEVNISLRNNAMLPNEIVGAYITSVTNGGPADLAGLRGDTSPLGLGNYDGDIIVSVNSIPIKSMNDLIAYLALNTVAGEDIVVGIYRDGREISILITLGSRPSAA